MEFIKKTQETYKLSAEAVSLLTENIETVSFAKKQIVLREGQKDTYSYFVEKGSVRTYATRDGREVNLLFAFEGDSVTSHLGESYTTLSTIAVETLEDTTFLRIPRKRIEQLFTESIELANWGRKFTENNLVKHEQYFTDYFWRDKAQQYRIMIKEYPGLLQRVSLKDLAAYLSITPQTLSRIRANIR